ncbi:YodC family protein [Pseudomonas fluorescens]
MSEFKKGDVVQLKSDGQKMTVADTGDYSGSIAGYEDGVKCAWFVGTKLHEKVFDAIMLKKFVSTPMGVVRSRLR